MSSDNAAPTLSREEFEDRLNAVRRWGGDPGFHVVLKCDADLRGEVQRLTEERDAAQRDYRLLTEYDQRTPERIEAVTGCKNFADLLIYCSDISALRAELNKSQRELGISECNRKAAEGTLQNIATVLETNVAGIPEAVDALRAELEAVKAERDNQYEFNVGQIEKYAALEAEADRVSGFLRVRLEEAERDTKRLDWVESHGGEVNGERIELDPADEDGKTIDGWACYGFGEDANRNRKVVSATHESLRGAIDAAISATTAEPEENREA